eukprot:4039267-Prymnesium_polylepis.1
MAISDFAFVTSHLPVVLSLEVRTAFDSHRSDSRREAGRSHSTIDVRSLIPARQMHCTPKYQNRLAKLAIEHFGDNLISYDEVCATQRAALLSPFDLLRRILLKGKVKGSKEASLTRGAGLASHHSAHATQNRRRVQRIVCVHVRGLPLC